MFSSFHLSSSLVSIAVRNCRCQTLWPNWGVTIADVWSFKSHRHLSRRDVSSSPGLPIVPKRKWSPPFKIQFCHPKYHRSIPPACWPPLSEKVALAFPREDEIAFYGSYPRRRPPYLRVTAPSGFHSALVDLQRLRNLSCCVDDFRLSWLGHLRFPCHTSVLQTHQMRCVGYGRRAAGRWSWRRGVQDLA